MTLPTTSPKSITRSKKSLPPRNTDSHSTTVGHALYAFLVRRRVATSLILFSSILTIEVLSGLAWHRVNLQSDILFGFAIGLVLLGVGIRSWAAGTIRKNSELATGGAYSLCRHPLYLGSFLMIAGFCLGTQPMINFPIVTPCIVLLYVCTIRSEETKLAEAFGDAWKSYSATTSRLLPNPLRSKLKFSGWSAAQWRQNREYQALLATLAGCVGLFAWYLLG